MLLYSVDFLCSIFPHQIKMKPACSENLGFLMLGTLSYTLMFGVMNCALPVMMT